MIFNVLEKDFFDKNIVDVITGIAGMGKSSVINSALSGRRFIWTTSTNKLKRDAIERYGCEAATACSALCTNENGIFYKDFKEPDAEIVVIDEILQTNKKIFDWIRKYRGKYKIIVLTDMKQMLAVSEDKTSTSILKEFEKLLSESFVRVYEGTETKRARDQKTKDKIEYLYTKSNEEATEFKKDAELFDIIRYEDMKYNTNDIYITHLNETEEMIYLDNRFAERNWDDDDLIAKGSLASKPPRDLSRYPVMSQSQATRLKATRYCQIRNVGSCTRYQGSEVTDKQKLYYIITQDSRITNREWYTVVSRCWTIDSIVIVIAPRRTSKKMTSFGSKKIKDSKVLTILGGRVV